MSLGLSFSTFKMDPFFPSCCDLKGPLAHTLCFWGNLGVKMMSTTLQPDGATFHRYVT